jgi:hypothetical protein
MGIAVRDGARRRSGRANHHQTIVNAFARSPRVAGDSWLDDARRALAPSAKLFAVTFFSASSTGIYCIAYLHRRAVTSASVSV